MCYTVIELKMKGHGWFIVHNLRLDPDELKSLLKEIMRQPYVEKYIEKPFIDNDKIMFLTKIYDRIELPEYEKRQLIITVMLVQTALDTHELIPVTNSTLMSETEKQLSVLAGDYYSGLYYLLLAEIDQIDMINLLANAIKQVNEYKMSLYYDEMNTFTGLVSCIMKIDSLLLTKVAQSFNMDIAFIHLIEKVCIINHLLKEIELIKQQQEPSYIYYYFKRHDNDADQLRIVQYIDVELEKQKAELDSLISLLPYSYRRIKSDLRDKFNLSYNTTLAEEG